jgi:CRISPR-associated protein Csx17
MTSSKATEHLVAPIEAWLRQFDDLDLKSAPEDFLVGLGSIRKAFADFYDEGAGAAPLQLLTSLAACEYTLAEEGRWVREHGIVPLQPLSPHWLGLVATRAPEMRLAIALNSLQPVETDDDVVTTRSHMESIRTEYVDAAAPDVTFDDGVSFERRTAVAWRPTESDERVWDKQNDVDGLQAILSRRLDASHEPYSHAGRGRIPALGADILAFIDADVDEGIFSRLAFVLALIDLSVIDIDLDRDAPAGDVDPEWALLQLALSRPVSAQTNERIPIKRDIHLVALRGDRESARSFASAHLRDHGFEVRDDLPASDRPIERIVAACAFPISTAMQQHLADIVAGRKS